MRLKSRLFLLLLALMFFFTCVAVTATEASETTKTDEINESTETKTQEAPAPQFQVNAKAAILVEAETGKTVYSFNENEPLPIASITKIMTMLLVMEAVDNGKVNMKDSVTISAYATKMGGSQVYLKEGELFTVEELMKAVAVHSANDAAVALAEKVAGSEEAFVSLMNERAAELKMKNTKFLDATGLTDEGHFSSALDIATMSRELLVNHPKIVTYTTIWHDSFRDGKFDLDNTNKLVKRYRGATGLKTGFTNAAKFCLSASAERDGTKFISVVLGAETNEMRFSESARLLDYGFTNWETTQINKKGLNAGALLVKKGTKTSVNTSFSENATIVVKKGKKGKITETVEIPETLNAPVKQGQVVGVLNVELDGERLASIPITANENSERASCGLVIGMMLKAWTSLFCR